MKRVSSEAMNIYFNIKLYFGEMGFSQMKLNMSSLNYLCSISDSILFFNFSAIFYKYLRLDRIQGFTNDWFHKNLIKSQTRFSFLRNILIRTALHRNQLCDYSSTRKINRSIINQYHQSKQLPLSNGIFKTKISFQVNLL